MDKETQTIVNSVLFNVINKVRNIKVSKDGIIDDFNIGYSMGAALTKQGIIDILYDELDTVNGRNINEK